MSLFYHRGTCRLCLSPDVELAVPLDGMPAATPNASRADTALDNEALRIQIPLDLYLCQSCGHLQLLHVVSPVYIYRGYLYTTSSSLGLPEHFRKSARELMDSIGLRAGATVVEIGSNDGTQLRAFLYHGCRVLGIDPAQAIAAAATRAGIETWGQFFNQDSAREIVARVGQADLLLANNVIANIDDMNELASAILEVLADNGLFVFQTQYGRDVIERTLIDTVYHEHLSYFNIKPLRTFFARHGLELTDVQRVATKGGSIMVMVQKIITGQRTVQPSVDAFIAEEEALGHYTQTPYQAFSARLANIRQQLNAIIDDVLAEGGKIAGYGVSVGSVSLLPQFGLAEKISCLFDDDPAKVGVLEGPGYNISVRSTEDVEIERPDAIIILAWRYAEAIMAKQQAYLAAGGRFIVPLPTVSEVAR
jgi:SAM-dependent methyltransferase